MVGSLAAGLANTINGNLIIFLITVAVLIFNDENLSSVSKENEEDIFE